MYAFRDSTGPVDLAFTDRYGGVSAVPFDSLDLALVGAGDEAARRRNVELLLEDFAPGAQLADMEQVHGHRVVVAGPVRQACDAVVTDRPGVALLVRVADCVPVLLADPGTGVLGAAHAGRNGTLQGVVPACVRRMRELGAERLTAWIGPHICGACYEVPAGLQAQVVEAEPAALATTSWGTPSLDLGAAVRDQLERDGVEVHDVSRCTAESEDLYSHRRDGVHAGRLAGVIVRRA